MKNLSLAVASMLVLISSAQVFAQQSNERLVFTPFPGETKWKEITNKSSADGWIRESIPADQDVSNIKDIIVAQGFTGKKLPDPSDFLKTMMKRSTSTCERVRFNGPNKSQENGYDVAYGQVYCGMQKGKDYGVNLFIKVLKGKEALYVVQREFHVPPTEVGGVMRFSADQMKQMQEMMKATNETMEYLAKGALVCGTSDTDTRCSAAAGK